MFDLVSSKVSFPEMEKGVLEFWKEKRIFQKSVEQRKNGDLFVFYEGPPTANASPGIHHVLARVFKDIIPRYKTMKGYCAPRKGGWDTHGLPVELEIERELGFHSKSQIEDYGVAEFNAKCRDSVLRYINDWKTLTERIGFWIDLDHPYITFENGYIESCWWIVKQLWEKGLIYQGYKVTPHCPRCETSLSSHEVAQGYEETDDPSVYIKFEISPGSMATPVLKPYFDRFLLKPAYLLAWTTTPWTLPGNTALAVAPDAEYAVMEGEDDYLIMASPLVGRVGLEGYREVGRVKGENIAGVGYKPLFNPAEFDIPAERLLRDELVFMRECRRRSTDFKKCDYCEFRFRCYTQVKAERKTRIDDVAFMRDCWERFANSEKCDYCEFRFRCYTQLREEPPPETFPIVGGDFVSLEEGTGIVHIAPAFGQVDYDVGREESLYLVQPVDLQGKVTGNYPFAGLFVKDADPLILDDLQSRGLLYRSETIRHTYPFCWRCGTPLLYYAKSSWYIKTTAVKERLISGNDEINWYPEHIKYGRFGDWLKNNVDWAFSRERYWGTPLPIWRCDSCGGYECVGSRDELKAKPGFAGVDSDFDLHRPFVDHITFDCSKCGGRMHRLPEVIDAWFDSGAMPVAQLHYPVENKELFEKHFCVADYISEAVDQTRGWFYTLHALSILLFDHPCFKNVICLGHILDSKGEKMSKSKGNVVAPWPLLDKYGADALRWYLYTASPPGNVRRFSEKGVAEVVRKFLLTLWNTYSFFVTYANIDQFVPGSVTDTGNRSQLDRWILSELNQLIEEVTQLLDHYDIMGAGRRMESFVDNLSNWYVRRSRRRFWKSENDSDKLAAYATLYQCLVTLAKLLAPFTPFLAEELYQNLVRSVDAEAPESVHLADFPEADLSLVDERLSSGMRQVMRVTSMGRAARAKAGIKVRQPLTTVNVGLDRLWQDVKQFLSQIEDELNVKQVTHRPPEELGENWEVVWDEAHRDCVAIDTSIPPELADEGIARELVRRLQAMRQSANFNIADRIETYYQGEAAINRVFDGFADYIKQETLSRNLIEGSSPSDAYAESHRINGNEVMLGVRRL